MCVSERLDDLLQSIDVREHVRRLNTAVKRYFTPLAAAAALYAGAQTAQPEAQYSVPEPARYELIKSSYSLEREFYVHVPSWVNIQKLPAHTMGRDLYGFTYPSTGRVYIRDDLFDDHETGELRETEVRLHEVAHNLYPALSEHQIRAHVRSILGSKAVIHSRLV